jgi:tagatose 1,6-diphosphate aldolase
MFRRMPLLGFLNRRQRFLDPGILRDRELELVQPTRAHAPDFLRAVQHPACAADPECAVAPDALALFLDNHPFGVERPDPRRGRPGSYRFWMRLHPQPASAPGGTSRMAPPPVPIAGTISLRISDDENTRRYYGHVGYLVFPPARGNRYAERSLRLLLPLARRHGMSELWITTNPENIPSRRTCERLGCVYVDTVDVPPGHPLFQRGERRKCRFRLGLA